MRAHFANCTYAVLQYLLAATYMYHVLYLEYCSAASARALVLAKYCYYVVPVPQYSSHAV